MSISLPTNKAEKKARYKMLAKQGSMSYQQAWIAYLDYCRIVTLFKDNKNGHQKT